MLHPGYLRKVLWERGVGSSLGEGGGGGGEREGVLGASWCCGNHCPCGLYSLSFQSFVLSQLVIAPV